MNMKMKTLMFVVLYAGMAFAQNGFTPVFDTPADFAQINDTSAWLKGHWVGKDMAGPSSSEIFCNKIEGTCTDTSANITVTGGMFILNADTAEYKVQRWNKGEIVAVIEGQAPCRLRQVLKIDRAAKKVTWMNTLAEPINPSLTELLQKTCTLSQMTLELKDGTSWNMK